MWLIRTFAPDARGHGTEAVIAAIHQRSGRIDWLVAPIKLFATVVTLAVGGSVGKEAKLVQEPPSAASIVRPAPRGWCVETAGRATQR